MVKQNLNLQVISVILVLFVFGCAGNTEYITTTKIVVLEKNDSLKADIEFPKVRYRLKVVSDTIRVSVVDSSIIYPVYKGVKVSEGDTLVKVSFFVENKYFEIWQRADTLYKTDTLTIRMPFIPAGIPVWQKLIWLGGALVVSFLIWKIKRNKKN